MLYRGDGDPQATTDPGAAIPGAPVSAVDGPARRKLLVLGLGNTLLTDDGAGVRVVNRLQQSGALPACVSLVDGGTLSFSLLGDITEANALVVVDAVHMDLQPGAVRCFEGEAMDRFLARKGQCSVHEVSLAELLDMARLQDRLPAHRALVAIQPGSLVWGPEPGAAVAAALPAAVARVRTLIGTWLP